MALEIVDPCTNCWACHTVCPNQAISFGSLGMEIDPDRCTECAEAFDDPQCAQICPVEGAIIDDLGSALNPPGSLGHVVSIQAPAP